MRISIVGVAAIGVALVLAVPVEAVSLPGMRGFETLFGRYGPGGDCTQYPQVTIDAAGFALDRGEGRVERADRPEHAPGYFGPAYEGIAAAFWPYWSDGGDNPFLVIVNHDETPGALLVEPHDFGWTGGPPMPARYQPWLQGSPYARCGG